MKETSNYHFKKPDYEDDADIMVINETVDMLDAAFLDLHNFVLTTCDELRALVGEEIENMNVLAWIADLATFGKYGYVFKDKDKMLALANSTELYKHDVALSYLFDSAAYCGLSIGPLFKILIPSTNSSLDTITTFDELFACSAIVDEILGSDVVLPLILTNTSAMAIAVTNTDFITTIADTPSILSLIANDAAIANNAISLGILSTTFINTLILNSESLNICISNAVFIREFLNSSVIMNIFAGSSTIMTVIANNTIFMNSLSMSSSAMAIVANSTIAMNAIASKSTALSIIVNNPISMAAITSNTALNVLYNNYTVSQPILAVSSIALSAFTACTRVQTATTSGGLATLYTVKAFVVSFRAVQADIVVGVNKMTGGNINMTTQAGGTYYGAGFFADIIKGSSHDPNELILPQLTIRYIPIT